MFLEERWSSKNTRTLLFCIHGDLTTKVFITSSWYILVSSDADPLYTTRGNLNVRAFRLTPTLIEMIMNGDPFTPDR